MMSGRYSHNWGGEGINNVSLFHLSCARLGLVSLAYLWQREQDELLHEMVDNGVEAILIKISSMGTI